LNHAFGKSVRQCSTGPRNVPVSVGRLISALLLALLSLATTGQVAAQVQVNISATEMDAAAKAADRMAQLIGSEGEVAIIAHDYTSRAGIDRVKGFRDRIAWNYPKITIVFVDYWPRDREGTVPRTSTDIVKEVIQAHPNLKGYFGADEGSMKGVMNGVKQTGKEGKIVMIGFDEGRTAPKPRE
jgi:ribose transport system substrate-binding protein